MIFLCFDFGAGSGLMTIGLMKAFPLKATKHAAPVADASTSANMIPCFSKNCFAT
jgi:hypothetical protein